MSLAEIHIGPILPLWLTLLLLAGGAAACGFQFRLLRKRLLLKRALLISLLRLCAFVLLALIALNPFWLERKEIRISPALAVLLDSSPSMGLPGNSGKGTRLDEAKEALLGGSEPVLKTLSEKYEVRFFELGESLKAFQIADLSQIKAGAKTGNLNETLETLAERNHLALLFSDGNVRWENRKAGDLPLLTYPVGIRDEYRDVLFKSVKSPSVAFRGKEVVIDAVIKGYGYEGVTVPLILKSGEKLLATQRVRLQAGSGEGTITISFTPEEIGSYDLSLAVPPQVGEVHTANNKRNFALKVLRDKIRILMVSGAPSMNYRFMRAALKNDPAIDLLSFVILRMPSNILNVQVQEQSLIPFPVDTLFTKDLKNFDLLIFDNFLYHPFFRTQYLGNIRDFVREGGAFAFIGGANFLGEGGYGGTPLEEILPTRWTGGENYRRPASLIVRPSRTGASHPITRFSADEANQRNLWQEMPPLGGFNPLESKNNGTVLLEGAEGGFWPILTIGTYGKGRALVLATDDSWKWYMGMVAKGKDSWVYLRLLERMVRWLTKDPSLDPVQIILPEKRGSVGQEVEIRINMREDDPSFTRRGVASLSVFDPEGIKIGSRLKTTGRPGEYLGSFLPVRGGTYRLRIETPNNSLEESLVIGSPMEDLDAAPQPERLRMISASTGGKLLSKNDDLLKEIGSYAGRSESHFIEVSTSPLWGRVYIFILILMLLTTEWYLRRRWGLV